MSDATIATARVQTANGKRYMTQLCKHWGHKFPVSFDETRGAIELPSGGCTMTVDTDALSVRVEAREAAGLARLEQVVEEHIKRFAFREELAFAWEPAAA